MKRVRVWVSGDVQGVGFRWWVSRSAAHLDLTGSAINLWDGRVEVDAQGRDTDVDELVRLLTQQPAPPGRPGRVRRARVQPEAVDPALTRFGIN